MTKEVFGRKRKSLIASRVSKAFCGKQRSRLSTMTITFFLSLLRISEKSFRMSSMIFESEDCLPKLSTIFSICSKTEGMTGVTVPVARETVDPYANERSGTKFFSLKILLPKLFTVSVNAPSLPTSSSSFRWMISSSEVLASE